MKWYENRILSAKNGTNPMVIKELKGGYVVFGDVQFLPGYCVLLPKKEINSLNDLTKLNEAITSAEKAKEADYTSETWKPFAESLATAKKVQKDAKAEGTKVTQKEVDSAIAALTKA